MTNTWGAQTSSYMNINCDLGLPPPTFLQQSSPACLPSVLPLPASLRLFPCMCRGAHILSPWDRLTPLMLHQLMRVKGKEAVQNKCCRVPLPTYRLRRGVREGCSSGGAPWPTSSCSCGVRMAWPAHHQNRGSMCGGAGGALRA
jgi:hypothetical protein